MLTHTYDESHEHIHNDVPTWCFDHGYYIIIIINLLLYSHIVYYIKFSDVPTTVGFSCCK